MASIEDLLMTTEEKMMAAVEAMENDFGGFRTGKASPALVENLMVDYYGTSTKLRDISGITSPEPRLLVIQPWDQNALSEIEKAIQASTLGISPLNDGRVIRLPIPELSEERRKQLTKEMRKRAEQARIEIRNHRRTANDESKKYEKASEITADYLKDLLDDIQKLTDEYIENVNKISEKKEKELMEL